MLCFNLYFSAPLAVPYTKFRLLRFTPSLERHWRSQTHLNQKQLQDSVTTATTTTIPVSLEKKKKTTNKMNETLPTNSTHEVPNSQRNLSFIATNVVLIITIIIAVFGNTLVCLACVISKRLQSFTSAFIISLAVTDILVGLISMPIWLCVNLTGKPDPVNFPNIYKAWLCFDIVCGTASIMNLVFISLDRLLAVNHPFRYPLMVTRNRITVAMAFIWIYSVIIAAINPLKWSSYPLFVSLASFFGPLLIMVFAYSRIFHVALTHARSIRRVQSDQSISHRRITENFHRDVKAARTLSIVIGAFVVCWCPFFVVTLVIVYCKTCRLYNEVLATTKWLHYGNSALNPLIYSCLNRNFRAAFKDVLIRVVNRRMTHVHGITTRQASNSVNLYIHRLSTRASEQNYREVYND